MAKAKKAGRNMPPAPQREQDTPRNTWQTTQGKVAPSIVDKSGQAVHPHWRNHDNAKQMYKNADIAHQHIKSAMDVPDGGDCGDDDMDMMKNKRQS